MPGPMDGHAALRRAVAGLILVAAIAALAGCSGSPGVGSVARPPAGSVRSPGAFPSDGTEAGAGSSLVATDGEEAAGPSDAPGSGPGSPVPDPAQASSAPSTPTATTVPSPAASPATTPAPALVPPPRAGPFSMDLFRKGDFVGEKTPIWCAPAALQTMINIMSPGADTTRKTQKLLHSIARKLGPAPDKGSEPEGEARTLTSLGYGKYRVLVTRTRTQAIHAAATAIRLTGRPAALLVWRGAHNWVMSGFRSTADPALGGAFRVTDLRIEDVWYPRISSIWGESRPPDVLVPARLMPEDYLPWRRPTGRYPGKDGRFVLIVPVAR